MNREELIKHLSETTTVDDWLNNRLPNLYGWEMMIGFHGFVYINNQDETVRLEDVFPDYQSEQTAPDMLQQAKDCISDRASERDTDNERSMLTTVNAFNAMFGTELTEEQGWQFMVLLKMARAKGGDFRDDDYIDQAAYSALAGECASKERG